MVIVPEVALTNPKVLTLYPEQEPEVLIIRDNLQVLWISQRGTEIIEADSTKALKSLAEAKGNTTKFNKFLVPNYGDESGNEQVVQDIGSFINRSLFGALGRPLVTLTLAAIQSAVEKVNKIPSGVVVPLGAMINTPYLPEDVTSVRNGTRLDSDSHTASSEAETGTDPQVVDPVNSIYKWKKVFALTQPGDWLIPKNDGAVEVKPPGRHDPQERTIRLNVVDLEKQSSILEENKNTEVNAFTLEIGHQVGGDQGQATLNEEAKKTNADLRAKIIAAGKNARDTAFFTNFRRNETTNQEARNIGLGAALDVVRAIPGQGNILYVVAISAFERTESESAANLIGKIRAKFPEGDKGLEDRARTEAFNEGLEAMADAVINDPFLKPSDESPHSKTSTVSQPRPWKIKLKFGEVMVHLDQSRSELRIDLGGEVTTLKTLNPGAGAKTTTNKGPNPYSLTFIPVWNGILVSDMPQASENWISKVTYIPKNAKVDVGEEIEKHLSAQEQEKPPRFGKDGEFLPRLEGTRGELTKEELAELVDTEANKAVQNALGPDPLDPQVSFEEELAIGEQIALSLVKKHEGQKLTDKARASYRQAAQEAKAAGNEEDQFEAGLEALKNTILEGVRPELGIALGEKNKGAKDAVEKAQQVDFGKNLDVTFERGGGLIQFKPVYFTDEIRLHYLHAGSTRVREPKKKALAAAAAVAGAVVGTAVGGILGGLIGGLTGELLAEEAEEPSIDDVHPKGSIFREPEVPCSFVVPVFYKNGNEIELTSGDHQLLAKEAPLNTYSLNLKRSLPGFRRPVCIWGYITYNVEDPENPACPGLRLNTREGFLRPMDVQEPRIRSVNITRNLDGGSGSLTWDRFGSEGYAFRPSQQAGRIALAVTGGVDTIPGRIYTGIGMGNAAKDSIDDDTVEVPLFGREIKMNDTGGGIRLINVPFFDGYDHREVMQYLADYAGVAFNDNDTRPYKLPAGDLHGERNSVVNFKSGTPVWAAIAEIQKLAATIAFFDRFGVLQYFDVGKTGQTDWIYPLSRVVSYDDNPDLTTVRNTVFIAALVSTAQGIPAEAIVDRGENPIDRKKSSLKVKYVAVLPDTTPFFPWDKMLFYVIPGVVKPGDVNREAARIARSVARPRATGSVTIPGNAAVELLDTFNKSWVITGISHAISTESKTWTTNLQLEFLMGVEFEGPAKGGEPEGPAEIEEVGGDDGAKVAKGQPNVTFDQLTEETQERFLGAYFGNPDSDDILRELVQRGKIIEVSKGKWGYGAGWKPPLQPPNKPTL